MTYNFGVEKSKSGRRSWWKHSIALELGKTYSRLACELRARTQVNPRLIGCASARPLVSLIEICLFSARARACVNRSDAMQMRSPAKANDYSDGCDAAKKQQRKRKRAIKRKRMRMRKRTAKNTFAVHCFALHSAATMEAAINLNAKASAEQKWIGPLQISDK